MLANYDEIIKAYEKENIIEKIEPVWKPGLVHYLPQEWTWYEKESFVQEITYSYCDPPSKMNFQFTVKILSGITKKSK